ncbi:hypothetical protein [Chitinophaga filiformis]|uniref:Uncharacterized protein n=1 Tax=Chitinophaga filiformis TaxID=104663 RepID=A0A1G7MED5_CHIFI|nr:hypothetical protein [Chitinophaga filiformis]SDF60026.1 hypothetical protein SAMN04488121_102390 [Chitinophaga filiformis]
MMKMKNAIMMMGLSVAFMGCSNQPELSKSDAKLLVAKLWKSDTLATDLNMTDRDKVNTPAIKDLEAKQLLTVTRKWTIADGGAETMALTDAARKYDLPGDTRYPFIKRLFVAIRDIEIKDIKYRERENDQIASIAYRLSYKDVSPFVVLDGGLNPVDKSAEFRYNGAEWVPVE